MLLNPRWLRVAGQHPAASSVLRTVAPWLTERGVAFILPAAESLDDYAQVDPTLETREGATNSPASTIGYGGLNPEQRHEFLLAATSAESTQISEQVQEFPPGYRQLYCAGLQVWLIELLAAENQREVDALLAHLTRLAETPHWHGDLYLSRTLLLAARLSGNYDLLQMPTFASSLAGVALGIEIVTSPAARLTAERTLFLATVWKIGTTLPSSALTALRLEEAHAAHTDGLLLRERNALPEASLLAKPFHAAHRDLRLSFPQPDLRPTLEPLLATLLTPMPADESLEGSIDPADDAVRDGHAADGVVTEQAPVIKSSKRSHTNTSAKETKRDGKEWHLVLEFRESRSEYAIFAMELARKQTGYTTLLDEDRTIVHRVLFRKDEKRRFWRLWEYVQGWNSTRVYLNGEELQKWQVWPWSQIFR